MSKKILVLVMSCNNKHFIEQENVVFTGKIGGNCERVRYTVGMIKEKTGWDFAKIYKTSTYR